MVITHVLAMTLKLWMLMYMPLISIENVYCCSDFDVKLICWCILGIFSIHISSIMIKSSNPKMKVCVTFKSFKCENFLWSWWSWKQDQDQTDDMQSNVLSLCILGVIIKLVPFLIIDICWHCCYNVKNWILTHKI